MQADGRDLKGGCVTLVYGVTKTLGDELSRFGQKIDPPVFHQQASEGINH